MKTKLHNIKLVGRVTYGKGLGQKFGFPTANLDCSATDVQGGVWAALAKVGSRSYKAVVNVGYSPSIVEDGRRCVEVHIVDFEGDLYGCPVEVTLCYYLRAEYKFASREALVAQIGRDREEALLLLGELCNE